MAQSFHRQLRSAAREGNAAEVARLWSASDCIDIYLDLTPMLDAIFHCHPAAALAMMEGLGAFASTLNAKIFRSRAYCTCHTTREKVKLLSILHTAGFDLGRASTFSLAGPIVHQHAQKLEGFCASNHARMEERLVEPDPLALIARPLGQAFHGTVPGSSRFDIAFRQPLLGRWRRLPQEARSLGLGLSLAGAAFAGILMLMPG